MIDNVYDGVTDVLGALKFLERQTCDDTDEFEELVNTIRLIKRSVIEIEDTADSIKNRVENNLPEAYVFINENTGSHYSKAKLGRIWNDARGKAGLDKSIRLYDAMRHSFATQLVNSNVPLFSVSRLLGHADIRTTEKYSHGDLGKLKIDISNLSLEEKVSKLAKNTNVDNSKI